MRTESTRTALHLLSTFELRRDEVAVHVSGPAQRLLAYLAFQPRPSQRRAVARTLWADCNEQQAAARLRSTLWRLPAPDGVKLVHADGGRVALTDEIVVDVHIVQDESCMTQLDVNALCGDVLADWSDDWVIVERERIRQIRLHRLEQLSERARHDGRYALALQYALAAAGVEPLRESAHRQVMLAHLAEHNPSEALRQFELIRRQLRDELGLAPSNATRGIVADLLGRPLDVRAAS